MKGKLIQIGQDPKPAKKQDIKPYSLPSPGQRAYFGHSKASYGTQEEKNIQIWLAEKYKVLCPNRDLFFIQSIEEFLSYITPGIIDFIALRANEHNEIGKGCDSEVRQAFRCGIPVFAILDFENGGYCLKPCLEIKLLSNNYDWRRYSKIII